MAAQASGHAAQRAPSQEQEQLGPLPDRQARHGCARLSRRAGAVARPPRATYSEGRDGGQPAAAPAKSRYSLIDSGGVEAVEAAHAGFGVRASGRAGCAARRRA